ncbi:MAG TPA: phosphate ABC transporter substrate-binding protein PstS [Acidimicrobiia bacterium]|nr:phosphate ABC transporter substrate-binding protein PstS [Acidimicrobiia bacterium]
MTAPTRLIRLTRALAVLAVAGLAASACSSDSGNKLNASGSTFQATFDAAAINGFKSTPAGKGVTINYGGGGSGKGKTDLQSKTVDFAGTDSLPKPEELSGYQGGALVYIPTVAAPITVSYNVSGVDSLKLSPRTVAGIFSGTITKWNDAAIAKDNPDATLPATNITIVHRSDASGTTSNFSKYLADAGGSAWTLGTPGDTVNWPTSSSQGGTGNAGVAQIVSSTDGAIGYVDFADAKNAKLKYASIKNKAGNFIEPTVASAAAAVAAATVGTDLSYSPLNTAGPQAYPITSPTWIIAYVNQSNKDKGTALKDFLTYVLNDGQNLAEANNYAKLPDSLRQKAIAQVDKLQIPA